MINLRALLLCECCIGFAAAVVAVVVVVVVVVAAAAAAAAVVATVVVLVLVVVDPVSAAVNCCCCDSICASSVSNLVSFRGQVPLSMVAEALYASANNATMSN